MKNTDKLKKSVCIIFAALMMTAALAGCKDDSSSSVTSDMKSNAEELVSDIREGATEAQTDITEAMDRMYSDGQVSDGDGMLGNEDDRDE